VISFAHRVNDIIWWGWSEVDKKFLLRISQDMYQDLEKLSEEQSINEYLKNIIKEHISYKKGGIIELEKIIIEDLKLSELREAVTVTQKKWYMDILEEYNIYFFSPKRLVSPMMYIFFYGDSNCDPANCISHIGKVKYIYRNVDHNRIGSIPEMEDLLKDSRFLSEILKWGNYQIAVLSEVERLERPIPLTKEYVNHPRIIVNRNTTIAKAFSAVKMDNMF
jgi:hypothetical protein